MDPTIDSPTATRTEYFLTIGKGKLKMHPQPDSEEAAIKRMLTEGHNAKEVKLVKEITYTWK